MWYSEYTVSHRGNIMVQRALGFLSLTAKQIIAQIILIIESIGPIYSNIGSIFTPVSKRKFLKFF